MSSDLTPSRQWAARRRFRPRERDAVRAGSRGLGNAGSSGGTREPDLNNLAAAADTLTSLAAAIEDPAEDRIAVIANDAAELRASANRARADLVVLTARRAPAASHLRLALAMMTSPRFRPD
jgi:hypothetical protein